MATKKTKIRICCGKCPKCGARGTDIEWSNMNPDQFPTQSGTCKKCGGEFTEVYKYNHTVVED
jgi:hypothetical protein